MFNLDPKKLAGMMSKLGIKQENIEAKKVIIEQENKNIIIENPSVTKINMQGNESFQVSGKIKEQEKLGVNEEDIKTIMEKTNCSEKQAIQSLKKANGDLAEAILSLQ